jgi:hypothetical protein
MWSSNAISSCTSLHGYPQALRHFIENKAPRGKKWLDNERALYNQRSHHYRMVASETLIDNEPEWFDMVLYRTPMARYFRPVDGVSQVYLRGFDSTASWAFLWRVCGYHPHKAMVDLKGNYIVAPFSINTGVEHTADNGVVIPSDWSVVLRLRDGKVDTSISAHRPVFKRVTSDDDKANRAHFRKQTQLLMDMMVLRIPSFHGESLVSSSLARPFSAVDFRKSISREAVQAFRLGTQDDADFNSVSSFAQAVYNKALSHRLSNNDSYYESLTWAGASGAKFSPLDATSFRAALSRALMKAATLDRKLGRLKLPQFPDSLPNEYTSNN